MYPMRKISRKTLVFLMGYVPERFVFFILKRMLSLKLESMSTRAALSNLLNFDNFIYGLTGFYAIPYGGGKHAKQRLTGYTDHFVSTALASPGPYLDIGCGNGEICHLLSTLTEEKVVGIDIEPSRISAARNAKIATNLSFVLGDATEYFMRENFGTLILSNVLEHIKDRVGFLKKLNKRYKPQAILIRVPLFERDWRVPLKKELGIEWRLDLTHFTEYTTQEFETEMADAGYQIETYDIKWGEIWARITPNI